MCNDVSNNFHICEECAKENDFKYPYCCLRECGEHEFCRGCNNYNNSSASDCKLHKPNNDYLSKGGK